MSTPAATLPAFLAARLAEDEAAAREATPGPWEFEGDDPTDDELFSVAYGEGVDFVGDIVAFTRGYSQQVPNGVHMARHDPARVLREVAAKRAILERHEARTPDEAGRGIICTGCSDEFDEPWPCFDVRQLAAIWCDHPDYRPEWAPATAEGPRP